MRTRRAAAGDARTDAPASAQARTSSAAPRRAECSATCGSIAGGNPETPSARASGRYGSHESVARPPPSNDAVPVSATACRSSVVLPTPASPSTATGTPSRTRATRSASSRVRPPGWEPPLPGGSGSPRAGRGHREVCGRLPHTASIVLLPGDVAQLHDDARSWRRKAGAHEEPHLRLRRRVPGGRPTTCSRRSRPISRTRMQTARRDVRSDPVARRGDVAVADGLEISLPKEAPRT